MPVYTINSVSTNNFLFGGPLMLAKRTAGTGAGDQLRTGSLKKEAWGIAKIAATSRVITVFMIIIFNLLFTNYDTSNIISNQHDIYKGRMDTLVKYVLDGFSNWDAVYFTWIADKGYSFEQFHAFFPLLPVILSILSRTLFFPLTYFLTDRSVILVAGVLVSNLSFVGATVALYILGRLVLEDRRMAYVACVLFSFCPSSVFMSVIYTESLFTFLSYAGFCMFYLDKMWQSSFLFSMAAAVRSNAILYCGFFVYDAISKTARTKQIGTQALIQAYILTIMRSFVVLVPYFLFQYYGYTLYCTNGMDRPWCDKLFPNLYDFVQKEYWNVGFMRYFRASQIPNFALAFPMIGISLYGIVSYVQSDPLSFFTAQVLGGSAYHKTSSKGTFSSERIYYSRKVAVFVYLWIFMFLFATFVMHIQVITRFFSSMPTVFWFTAHLTLSHKGLWRRLIFAYFGLYFVLGPLLFSNFYPWT